MARRAVVVVTVGILSLPGLFVLGAPTPVAAAPSSQPNIVIILTDDQPTNTMAAMPGVRSTLRDKGMKFENAIIPTAVCCPSRASLLTGNQSHATGVYTNEAESGHGGWPAFVDDEDTTLATQLSAVGYRTGLFGKYLNGFAQYGWDAQGADAVPPGWDEFLAFRSLDAEDAAYYDYSLVGTQELGPFGRTAADYSTDVLSQRVVDFIDATPDTQALFVMFTPYGPHSPLTPAPRHQGTWRDRPLYTPEGVNEKNLSDKPSWLRSAVPLDERALNKKQRHRMETLRSVDEAVLDIVRALGPRASNTLFVFLSDNGQMQGVHRLTRKNMPYALSSRVPLIMRWDGVITPGTVSTRVTPNIDVTATIADAAGVRWSMEGRSALTTARQGVVLEAMGSTDGIARPAYCGWRTQRYLYVRYSGGQDKELYDYRRDPYELENVAGSRAYRDIEARLRQKTKDHCQPVPPDFSWN